MFWGAQGRLGLGDLVIEENKALGSVAGIAALTIGSIPEMLGIIYLNAYMLALYLVQQKLPVKKLQCQGFGELVKMVEK